MNSIFYIANLFWKAICGTILLSLFAGSSFAQKPPLDTSALDTWPEIYHYGISSDGKYSYYVVDEPTKRNQTLNVVSNMDEWNCQFTANEISDISFSLNSRYLIFLKSNNSLGIFNLRLKKKEYIPNVTSVKVAENSNYLAYKTGDSLIVRNLNDNSNRIVTKVINFDFAPAGKSLNFVRQANAEKQQLGIINLANNVAPNIIIVAKKINHYNFDENGKNIAFLELGTNGKNSIGFYNLNKKLIVSIPEENLLGLNKSLTVSSEDLIFSKNSDEILVHLKKNDYRPATNRENYANVRIWNADDEFSVAERSFDTWKRFTQTQYWGIINIDNQTLTPIYLENEEISRAFLKQGGFEKEIFVSKRLGPDFFYKKDQLSELYKISVDDGKKQIILKGCSNSDYHFSPDKKFVLWFDPDSLCFFSYDVGSKIIRNISQHVPEPLYDVSEIKANRRFHAYFNIGAWDTLSQSVFLYDNYDIWKINLQDARRPINVTDGYGKSNNLVFSFLKAKYSQEELDVENPTSLLIEGYDRSNKNNGFWKISIKNSRRPEKLTMGPYAYFVPRTGSLGWIGSAEGYLPIKATSANIFLVRRGNIANFPNLYVTRDFKSFTQISNLNPEKNYNWVTDTLIKWKMIDGNGSQGILYKPENFDPAKKYPVIFEYYEKRSDELNKYIEPSWSGDRINIPYFVSNGYLVFVPDIYYQPGHSGDGVINAVVSAAEYLKKLPYVDANKLGLQGHSFGGWETNFLITHTKNLFTAACEAAGVSDQISGYDQMNYPGVTRQNLYEFIEQGSAYGIGTTPWTALKLYAENSPVLSVAGVTTPLLMSHGDLDSAVPYPQAQEMFQALKRAGKKVWLLEYKNAEHSLGGDDAKDLTNRMADFFGYYLKNGTFPEWMKSTRITK